MKKAIITQSNYIPWKGYFDAINSVDVFVVYDEMQYTKRDWRNRNKIKTANGLKWMSIPVSVKGKFNQKINETLISDQDWGKKHWQLLKQVYGKAPFFNEYKDIFEKIYLNCNFEMLSDVNVIFIDEICKLLGIETEIIFSKDLNLQGDKTEKLLNVCLDLKVTDYYSGPAAKAYMDVGLFEAKGVQVHWFDYSGYPEYSQQYGAFEHGVTILDLIFNEGVEGAKQNMKSFKG
ncbi:MAG: WbqC family protein [Flavobacteriales bacterium]|jgi:hypothetical protein|nr:WbqC family protein [Flavobacteriales bacterium]